MNNNEGMTSEQTKKAEIINNRLNTLSIETRGNLDAMLEINNIILGSDLAEADKSEKGLKTCGWFDNVIDMLKTIDANDIKLKTELMRLRKEFKK